MGISGIFDRLMARVLHSLPARTIRQLAKIDGDRDTFSSGSERQILVDISATLRDDKRTGIQRVVRAWLSELLKNPPPGFCVRPIFADFRLGYRYAVDLSLNNGVYRATAECVRVAPGDIFLGLDLSAHLLPRWQFQFFRWKRAGVRIDIVVHDLLPLLSPDWFSEKTVNNFKRWTLFLEKYADNLICTTSAVAGEVSRWQAASRNLSAGTLKLHVVPLGADIRASTPSNGMSAEHREFLKRIEGRQTILTVGTIEPRKGHVLALDAMDRIWERGGTVIFVMIGRAGWKTEELQRRVRTHDQYGVLLFWLDDASDEVLEKLYELVTGIFIPSHAEGFGLPLVEGMFYGRPLLARDLAVFREIAGDQIDYFADDDPVNLALRIELWLRGADENQRVKYQVKSWKESAMLLRNLYIADAQ